jgi:hypothetical protein
MDEPIIFGLSFLFNSGVALLILRVIYAPAKRDKDYVLMFLTFNTLAFLISSLLGEVDFSVGLGLSLFALFSILRFRTDPIPIREMTYLFVMMALPVANAVLIAEGLYGSLLLANAAVGGALMLTEREWGLRDVDRKVITYERVEWVKPEHIEALLDDLRARTGLEIHNAEVGKLDFLHDTAEVTITYSRSRTGARKVGPPSPVDHGAYARRTS